MDLLLTSLLTPPVLGSLLGLVFALAVLTALLTLPVVSGLYYSVPRLLAKWFSRRAIRVA